MTRNATAAIGAGRFVAEHGTRSRVRASRNPRRLPLRSSAARQGARPGTSTAVTRKCITGSSRIAPPWSTSIQSAIQSSVWCQPIRSFCSAWLQQTKCSIIKPSVTEIVSRANATSRQRARSATQRARPQRATTSPCGRRRRPRRRVGGRRAGCGQEHHPARAVLSLDDDSARNRLLRWCSRWLWPRPGEECDHCAERPHRQDRCPDRPHDQSPGSMRGGVVGCWPITWFTVCIGAGAGVA